MHGFIHQLEVREFVGETTVHPWLHYPVHSFRLAKTNLRQLHMGFSFTVSLTMADKAEYQAMKSLNAISVAISHGPTKENK